MDRPKERRELHRLRLPVFIDGSLGNVPVQISELGLLGARVMHGVPVTVGSVLPLLFAWDGKAIELECRVIRSSLAGGWNADPASHDFESGLRMTEPGSPAVDLLRDLLSASVTRELGRRFSKSESEPHSLSGDVMVRSRDAPFVSFRLDAGGWRQAFTFLPDQPERGFTVATGEDEDELALLRRTYAQSSDEGRDLVKLFAELSVQERLRLLEPSALQKGGSDGSP